MQRSMLISYMAAYFFFAVEGFRRPGWRSAASIVMASAGQARHKATGRAVFRVPARRRFEYVHAAVHFGELAFFLGIFYGSLFKEKVTEG